MNVAAFTDVLANAVEVQIAETIWIPVASLAGLAILKLFAWLDRRDPRDAADLKRPWKRSQMRETQIVSTSPKKRNSSELAMTWS
jgi:hypothetical protein